MPVFEVRGRETRVHVHHIEAASEEEAMEIARDMDAEGSIRDTFDEWEVLDVSEIDAPPIMGRDR